MINTGKTISDQCVGDIGVRSKINYVAQFQQIDIIIIINIFFDIFEVNRKFRFENALSLIVEQF